jgi:hypothetical protein
LYQDKESNNSSIYFEITQDSNAHNQYNKHQIIKGKRPDFNGEKNILFLPSPLGEGPGVRPKNNNPSNVPFGRHWIEKNHTTINPKLPSPLGEGPGARPKNNNPSNVPFGRHWKEKNTQL